MKRRTVDLKPSPGEMIKPAELVDISGAGGLSLFAGKVYNRLLHNAFGPGMAKQGEEFTIPLAELRGLHKGNERIRDVVVRLMKTIVVAKLSDGGTRLVALLGGCDLYDEDRPNGTLTYTFDKRLVTLLRHSSIFAKLELKVIHQFQSRYALALYEAVCRRVRMEQCVENFSLEEFRELLRVPDSKLERFADLHRRAIQPALLEVNGLADFEVMVRPHKRGKRVVGVTMAWSWKDKAARREAWAELQRPRVGRKARLKGAVEDIAPLPSLTEAEIEEGYIAAAKMGVRVDKRAMYEDWRRLVASFPEPPVNPVAHFIVFCQQQAEMLR